MSKKTDTDIITEAVEAYLIEAPELRLVHGGKKTDPVMFRKSKEDGEVTAVFPAKGYEATRDGHATAYAHVGQHGAAHPDWIEQDTVPLDHTSPEAQSLHKELTGKGYKLEPISPEHHGAHIKNIKKRMAVVESVTSLTEAKLKFSPDHYTELKKRVSALADKIPGHVEAVRKSGKFKDLGMRIRFDVLHATKMHQDHDLYANGVNDDHINSALKSVFKELNIKDS